jgi:hypothetical protein
MFDFSFITRARRGLPRIIGVLVVCASLAGCSMVKLGYGTLPEVSYWWLDAYLDFSDDQDGPVRDEIARLHDWHRANELPRIADMLSRAEQLAAQPVTAAQVCAFMPEVQERISALADRALPAAAALARTLTPRQLRHMERKYARNNAEWRKDMIETPSTGFAKREKQWLERMELVYGTLEDAQRAAARNALVQSSFDPGRILRERQRRQADLLQTLRTVRAPGTTVEQARGLLADYVGRTRRSPDPDYRAWQDRFVEEGCRVAAATHASATPEQRANAVRRLRAWQRDLRELAGSP